jgi:hypothetical protein
VSDQRPPGFYANLNWSFGWATIHIALCPRTRHADDYPRPRQWIGPFETSAAAIKAGQLAGFGQASPCAGCKPYAP